MVSVTGEETVNLQNVLLRETSETEPNFANHTHRNVYHLNKVYRMIHGEEPMIRKPPLKVGDLKISKARTSFLPCQRQLAVSHNQSTNAVNETNGHIAQLKDIPEYAAFTLWNKSIRDPYLDLLTETTSTPNRSNGKYDPAPDPVQNESILSDVLKLILPSSDNRQNTELVEEKPKQNTSLEPSKSPERSQDIIQATPLESDSWRQLKRFQNSRSVVQTCSNENIDDGSDSEIPDMNAVCSPIKKWKNLRKNRINNVSDASAVCLGNLDHSEASIKTTPQTEKQHSARSSLDEYINYFWKVDKSEVSLNYSPKHEQNNDSISSDERISHLSKDDEGEVSLNDSPKHVQNNDSISSDEHINHLRKADEGEVSLTESPKHVRNNDSISSGEYITCLGNVWQVDECEVSLINCPKYVRNNDSISSGEYINCFGNLWKVEKREVSLKKRPKHVQNSGSVSKEHACCSDSFDMSDMSFEEIPKKRVKNYASLSTDLDDSEILMKKRPKKWKKSDFSIGFDETQIRRRRNRNYASASTANVSYSELADEFKISLRKPSNKSEQRNSRKKENTRRSKAVMQEAMDSCESEVETSISNCKYENHKSDNLIRAKRKRKSAADEENDQASKTIKKKAKKVSAEKKPRLSSDTETSDDSYEDAGHNISDAALKFFVGLKKFNRDFKVPLLHKIVDRASKPTANQREQIAEKGIEVKTSKFSSAEDQQIHENWHNFIRVFRLKDHPQNFFCLHAKRVTAEAKRNFLFYLARRLPNRTPYSVFKRFKLLMDRVTKGRFSQEEDEVILKAMEGKRKMPVTEVAKYLHRSLLAVSCRMNKLKTTYSRKIKWSGRNAATYIKSLLEATDIDEKDIGLLKNRHISTKEWSKLSEHLDNVPVRILKPVWLNFLHPALFIPGNSCELGEIKWKLAKSLHKNNETEWSCVDWTKYVARFEGFTSLKLYTLLKQLVKTHVPERKQANLAKSLKHLMKNKLDIAAKPLKVLYKIKYRNGKIKDMKPVPE